MGTYVNPGGRPTKFKPEYTKALIDFFDVEPMRKEVMAEASERGGKESKTYKYVPNYFPTLVRFAKSINVDYTTVYGWAMGGDEEALNKKLEAEESVPASAIINLDMLSHFAKAYKHCKAIQKDFLIQNGLTGASPASAFIFTAKNVTDMRDKVESEVTVKTVRPLLDNLRTKKIDGKDVKVIDAT